mmetsp:Transcript_37752/g.60872  ORF Transcript_37752/g.60872 Transcript_37752/m.60872 type:complete len:234 (+) Transcript_37752:1425-2126(+)
MHRLNHALPERGGFLKLLRTHRPLCSGEHSLVLVIVGNNVVGVICLFSFQMLELVHPRTQTVQRGDSEVLVVLPRLVKLHLNLRQLRLHPNHPASKVVLQVCGSDQFNHLAKMRPEMAALLFELAIKIIIARWKRSARWTEIQDNAFRVRQIGFFAKGHRAGDAQLLTAAQVLRKPRRVAVAFHRHAVSKLLQLSFELCTAALPFLPGREARHGGAPHELKLCLVIIGRHSCL